MGKVQSKRSVDITTEAKEGSNAEVVEGTAGKLGKIEEVDQLKSPENDDANKEDEGEKLPDKEHDASETEKDKVDQDTKEVGIITSPSPDNVNVSAGAIGDETATPTAEKVDENTSDETIAQVSEESATHDENVSELNEDEEKKPKKEKVKKRWSFRSFSFSKKDKQKPSKKDGETVAASTLNGECEKVLEENNEDAAAAENDNAEGVPAETNTPTTSIEPEIEAVVKSNNIVESTKQVTINEVKVLPASAPVEVAPASAPVEVAPVSSPVDVAPASAPVEVAPASAPVEVAPTPIETHEKIEPVPILPTVAATSQANDKLAPTIEIKPIDDEHYEKTELVVPVESTSVDEPVRTAVDTEDVAASELPVATSDVAVTVPVVAPQILKEAEEEVNTSADLNEEHISYNEEIKATVDINPLSDIVDINPPPLPMNPPPSQISVFAESAIMSDDEPTDKRPAESSTDSEHASQITDEHVDSVNHDNENEAENVNGNVEQIPISSPQIEDIISDHLQTDESDKNIQTIVSSINPDTVTITEDANVSDNLHLPPTALDVAVESNGTDDSDSTPLPQEIIESITSAYDSNTDSTVSPLPVVADIINEDVHVVNNDIELTGLVAKSDFTSETNEENSDATTLQKLIVTDDINEKSNGNPESEQEHDSNEIGLNGKTNGHSDSHTDEENGINGTETSVELNGNGLNHEHVQEVITPEKAKKIVPETTSILEATPIAAE